MSLSDPPDQPDSSEGPPGWDHRAPCGSAAGRTVRSRVSDVASYPRCARSQGAACDHIRTVRASGRRCTKCIGQVGAGDLGESTGTPVVGFFRVAARRRWQRMVVRTEPSSDRIGSPAAAGRRYKTWTTMVRGYAGTQHGTVGCFQPPSSGTARHLTATRQAGGRGMCLRRSVGAAQHDRWHGRSGGIAACPTRYFVQHNIRAT